MLKTFVWIFATLSVSLLAACGGGEDISNGQAIPAGAVECKLTEGGAFPSYGGPYVTEIQLHKTSPTIFDNGIQDSISFTFANPFQGWGPASLANSARFALRVVQDYRGSLGGAYGLLRGNTLDVPTDIGYTMVEYSLRITTIDGIIAGVPQTLKYFGQDVVDRGSLAGQKGVQYFENLQRAFEIDPFGDCSYRRTLYAPTIRTDRNLLIIDQEFGLGEAGLGEVRVTVYADGSGKSCALDGLRHGQTVAITNATTGQSLRVSASRYSWVDATRNIRAVGDDPTYLTMVAP